MFKSYPTRSFLLLIFTTSFILISAQYNKLDQFAKIIVPEKKELSHTQVLISATENIDAVSRKIRTLPGIFAVSVTPKEEIEKKVNEIISDVGIKETQPILNDDYGSIKIIFEEKMTLSSKKLIQEYLIRLVGQSNIFLGPIINPQTKINSDNTFFKSYWKASTLIATGIFYLVFFTIFNIKVREYSYYIEQFQRRKNSAPKIMITAMILTAIPSILTILFYFVTPVSINHLIISLSAIVAGVILFNIKRTTWQN